MSPGLSIKQSQFRISVPVGGGGIRPAKMPSRLAWSGMEKTSPLAGSTDAATGSGTGAVKLDAAVGQPPGHLPASVPVPRPPPAASPQPGRISEVPPHTTTGKKTSQDRLLPKLAEANVPIATCSITCPILLQNPPKTRPVLTCSRSSLGRWPGAASDRPKLCSQLLI